MYMDTIVEGRAPTRKVVLEKNMWKEIKWWVPRCNVYVSVYKFSSLLPTGRPDWNTSELDKIWIDVDIMDSRGNVKKNPMPDIVKWLNENDYKRHYRFTGGGFHVFVGIKNATRDKLYTAHYNLRSDKGFDIDKSAIDIARGTRPVPSFNFNKKCYVSNVTEEETLDFDECRRKYSTMENVNMDIISYGSREWDLANLNSSSIRYVGVDPGPIQEAREDLEIDEIEKKYGKICDTVVKIATQEHVSHHERYFIVLYIKDVLKVPYDEFTSVYKTLLNKSDYIHSLSEEQARYAYSGTRVFNPKVFKMLGECPMDCTECIDTMEMWNDVLGGVLT